MNEVQLDRFQRSNPGLLLIQSDAQGMYYGTVKNDPGRILLIGDRWYTILNHDQALALVDEILDVFDEFAGKENIPYGEEMDNAYRIRYKWWFDKRDAICFSENAERKRRDSVSGMR